MRIFGPGVVLSNLHLRRITFDCYDRSASPGAGYGLLCSCAQRLFLPPRSSRSNRSCRPPSPKRLLADKPRSGALPRVKCALACGYGMQLHDGLPRRHVGVTGPPGGMPDDRQRPRSGGGACASHCTESPGRPLSCPVESPHALSERETVFSCRMPPRNPKGRGVPVQKIDVFAIFNLFGVSGQKLKLFGDRHLPDGQECGCAQHSFRTRNPAYPSPQHPSNTPHPRALPFAPVTTPTPPLPFARRIPKSRDRFRAWLPPWSPSWTT